MKVNAFGPFSVSLGSQNLTSNQFILTASADKTARVWDASTGEAVTPPLRHHSAVKAAKFAPDGRSIVTCEGNGFRLWELPVNGRSSADWQDLARFLDKRSVDAKGTNVSSPAVFQQKWLSLHEKFPPEFTISKAEIDAWTRHEARRAEAHADWPNAVRHLNLLVTQHPDSPDLSLRRAAAHSAWVKELSGSATNVHLQAALADYDRVLTWLDRRPEVLRLGRKMVQTERRKVLVNLHRWSEAQEALRETLDIAPRPAAAGTNLIDLSRWYNWNTDELRPDSLRTLVGVKFDVRASIELKNKTADEGEDYPEAVLGIKAGMKCQQLHFLHTAFTTNETAGLSVGKFVIHLANGKAYTREIKLGEDVWDFTVPKAGVRPVTNSRVAWTGPTDDLYSNKGQVFLTTWTNPSPDIIVESIDFISAMNEPAPCLYAITAEP